MDSKQRSKKDVRLCCGMQIDKNGWGLRRRCSEIVWLIEVESSVHCGSARGSTSDVVSVTQLATAAQANPQRQGWIQVVGLVGSLLVQVETLSYNRAYCPATVFALKRFAFSSPAAMENSRAVPFSTTWQIAPLIAPTSEGSTVSAPTPATSFIGERLLVITDRPIACASMIGIPNPSASETKTTRSA